MTTQNELAQIITATALKKKLDKFIKEKKVNLELGMAPGDSTSVKFDLDGQQLQLGKVTMTDPKLGWKLVDPDALAEWAEKNMPELGHVEFVLDRDAVEGLMKSIVERNGAFTDEGELIPGVEWTTTSNPYVRLSPDKAFDDAARLIASEGRLTELTGGVLGIEQ